MLELSSMAPSGIVPVAVARTRMSPAAAELSVTVKDADGSVTAIVSLWASPVLEPPNTRALVPLICAALRSTVELQVRAPESVSAVATVPLL